jgi:hypothetical protein
MRRRPPSGAGRWRGDWRPRTPVPAANGAARSVSRRVNRCPDSDQRGLAPSSTRVCLTRLRIDGERLVVVAAPFP